MLAVVAATAVSAQATLKPLNIKQKAATEQKAANAKKMARIQFTPPITRAAGDLPSAPVTQRPEGRSVAYHLSGGMYYATGDGGASYTASAITDTGLGMEAVYSDDGTTVWLKGSLPMSSYSNVWLKGTLADGGSRIQVEAGQMLGYMQGYVEEDVIETFDVRLYPVMFEPKDGNMSSTGISSGPIEYVIDGDEIRLDCPSDGTLALGEVFTLEKDGNMSYFQPDHAVYSTAFTRLDMEKSEMPEGLKMSSYIVSSFENVGATEYSFTMKVGIDCSDIYLSGMLPGLEDDGVALKGTFDGEKAVFPAGQLLTLAGCWIYMQPYSQASEGGQTELEPLDEFVFAYDKETGTFTSDAVMVVEYNYGGSTYHMYEYAAPKLSSLEDMRRNGRAVAYRLSKASAYSYGDDGNYSYIPVDAYIGMEMIYDNDGETVWLKNIAPIVSAGMDFWVKGKLVDGGTRILVQAGQAVSGSYALYTLSYTTEEGVTQPTRISGEAIPYTIDGDRISLDLPADGSVAVGTAMLSGSQAYLGDAGMFGTEFQPMEQERTVQPAGLETEDYVMTYTYIDGGESRLSVKVGFDGTDMYIGGLFDNYMEGNFNSPETAWIKGTFDGNKAVFKPGQLIMHAFYWYYLQPFRPVEYNGATYYESIEELTFTYNEATRTFTCGDILAAEIYNTFNNAVYFPYISPTLAPAVTSGISRVDAEPQGEVVKTEYYTLSGMKVDKPQRGIYIKTMTYADGTRRSVKVAQR